ncbi:four helix bundle protein [Candidatus Azambacteria bacterium]|nr:four helix bundle protein [Candidatus Azambacteria bacterium]MBI3685707.1 four helix bundle protein [Candidatus Azambacteria bacterium]
MKTQTYKDLIVWQKSKQLVIEIYSLTEHFPPNEKFGIISQFHRAAISIPLNIAEGYRRRGDKERRQFFSIAFGSGAEVEALIDICKDLPRFKNIDFSKAEGLLDEVLRMLNVFIQNSSPNSTRYSLNSKFSPQGFSLVELIIYVGIFSVIAAIFVGVLFHANLGWTRSKVESEVQQNLRFAMEDIARTVQSATSITSPAVGSSASALTVVSGGLAVQYSLSSAVLQKQVGADPVQNLTTDKVNVTYLNFKTLQNTAVSNTSVQATSTQFGMTVAYNATNNQFTYVQSATSTATLKNK